MTCSCGAFRYRAPVRPGADKILLDDALPAIWQTCASELSKSAGDITCRERCAACCRHLVPLAPAEARRLLGVVSKLPQERQDRLLRRFAELRKRLTAAGLWELLVQLADDPAAVPADGRRWLATAYRNEQAPCPFLDEEERCSIYDERPLACRLQAVTSDPAACYRPHLHGRVVPLRIAGRPAVRALAEVEEADWLPLACLLDAGVPATTDLRPSDEWLAQFEQARRHLPTADAVAASAHG